MLCVIRIESDSFSKPHHDCLHLGWRVSAFIFRILEHANEESLARCADDNIDRFQDKVNGQRYKNDGQMRIH